MRVLGIDPGEKNIGVAISDPSKTIAAPLTVIKHVARTVDAAAIASFALENEVELIVVGKALDDDGASSPQSRRADRLVQAIQTQCDLPVTTWDESFSTHEARQARILMNSSRRKRRGHLDDLAAVVMLQSFLDGRETA